MSRRAAAVALAALVGSLLLAGCAALSDAPIFTLVAGSASGVTSSGDPEPLSTGRVVNDGLSITTSGGDAISGLEWPDGAVMRLGPDTTWAAGGADAGGERVRGSLGTGTAWARVEGIGGGGFALATPAGTLVASDAAFVVECDGASCTVSVIQGVVTTRAAGGGSLVGPASATLGSDGFSAPQPLPWDAGLGDPFVSRMAVLDGEAGFAPESALYAGADPSIAGMSGDFSGFGTFEGLECTGPGPDCASILADAVGDEFDEVFTFSVDCSGGIPCVGTVVAPVITVGDAESHDEVIPIAFDGTSYTWSSSSTGPICEYDDGSTDGVQTNTLTWTLTPVDAAVVDGEFVVMAAVGSGEFHLVVDTPPTDAFDDCSSSVNEWTVLHSYDVERDIASGSLVEDQANSAPARHAVTASRLRTGAAGAPSVLSALPTIREAAPSAGQATAAGAAAIVLVVLVAFPTTLLNSAIEGAPGRWRALTRRSKRAGAASAEAKAARNDKVGSAAWWRAALGVVAGGVIAAFVDPQLGLNAGSARVLLTLAIAFLIDVVLGWSATVRFARRIDASVTTGFQFKPWSLGVVALAVILTRITHFEPGIVFGLVAGVVIGTAAAAAAKAKAIEARASLTQPAYSFALGVAAWVGYSAARGSWGEAGGFWGQLLTETLAGITVAGIAATPIAFLPLRGLGGEATFAWRKWAWALAYAVGLVGFFVIVMPMPTSWAEVALPVQAWFGLYVAYLVFAIAAWLVVARPWARDAQAQPTSKRAATRRATRERRPPTS